MARTSGMAARLPPLYGQGELTEALIGVPGVALEIVAEDMVAIQRSHWFDQAVDRPDGAALAMVLDLAPEPWQGLATFRAWLHALRDAMLLDGAVTRAAVERFVRAYTRTFAEAAGGAPLPPVTELAPEPRDDVASLVEQPPRRREARAPLQGGIEPLHRFTVRQTGLDPTLTGALLTGLPEGRECAPVIANLTTRQALIFRGVVGVGERLWITPDGADRLHARLEARDVDAQVVSVNAFEPGRPWDEAAVLSPARSLTLVPGDNDLWFLPVAHFDVEGLDRFLLALADLEQREGVWDRTLFDHSLFALDPAVTLHLAWTESEPAAFEVRLPAGTMLHRPGELADTLATRDELATSLDRSLGRLRPAGVRAAVVLGEFSEVQRAAEHLVSRQPVVVREVGPTGADSLPDAGGVFGTTPFDESTYR